MVITPTISRFQTPSPFVQNSPVLQRYRFDNAASAGSIQIPERSRLVGIVVENTTANAITGGLKFGTTAGATDINAALAVGANAFVDLSDGDLSKRVFSTTAKQMVYFGAVTAWNSAVVNIDFIFMRL